MWQVIKYTITRYLRQDAQNTRPIVGSKEMDPGTAESIWDNRIGMRPVWQYLNFEIYVIEVVFTAMLTYIL